MQRKIKLPHKVFLANLPTPIHRLDRLSETFGVDVFIKRDDMTGGVETGNKIRKLEFIVADALRKGYDTIVTCGGADSNHCRATAVACARYGLHAVLLLRKPTADITGNLVLDKLVGADVRLFEPEVYYSQLANIKDEVLTELDRKGKKGYWVPVGASIPLGAVGYVGCAAEVADFEKKNKMSFDVIFFATGSGGTAGGLLVGSKVFDLKARIVGVNTGEDASELRRTTLEVARGCAAIIGSPVSFKSKDVIILNGYDAGGYGLVDENVVNTILRFAREEGIVLDPVYTAKAAAGMVGEMEKGKIRKGKKVLFIHTGGVFGLFAHRRLLLGEGD
jgi:D-cysteine desulfhydrase